MQAERLTLAVLLSGVAALALSDFVSPLYWGIAAGAAVLRWWRGPQLALTEMQASMIGWAGFVWVGIELIQGRAWVVAFTDFLLILALAVTIEEATPRNHLHRMISGLFLVLAGAVLTDSVLYALPLLALLIFTWRAAACLYGMQMPGGNIATGSWRADGKVWFAVLLGALLLFVTLPRFEAHSVLKATQPRMVTSGFSNQVQLGDFARKLDATVVLRVEAPGVDPVVFRQFMLGRYWRGTVLSQYTGHGWQQMPEGDRYIWPRGVDAHWPATDERHIRVYVYREASDHAFVMRPQGLMAMVDVPERLQEGVRGSLHFSQPPSRRLRLSMQLSRTRVPWYVDMPPIRAEQQLNHVPDALVKWAGKVVGDSRGEEAVRKLNQTLLGWSYDLQAPIDEAQPMVSFLQLKRGHCELYATALALAARTQGIPSRVINGYRDGEWNEAGGFWLLRQQHAHSWTEVWLDGHWQRFDPTPSSRWTLTAVRFAKLDAAWEAVRMSWYRYVLDFQDSDRGALLGQLWLFFKQGLPWLLSAAAIFVLLRLRWQGMFGWVFAWRHRKQALWRMMDRWLYQRGLERRPAQPLRGLALPSGVKADDWQDFVERWEHQAYRATKPWSTRELRRQLRALS